MREDEPDAMGLGVPPPPVAYLGPLILGLWLNRKIPAPFLPRGLSRVLGLALIGGGVLLEGWTYRTMRRVDTPMIGEPFVPGKPASTLITDGPFRYTRNPAYPGAALVYAGIASFKNTLWAVLLLPVTLLTVQRTAIRREERYLWRRPRLGAVLLVCVALVDPVLLVASALDPRYGGGEADPAHGSNSGAREHRRRMDARARRGLPLVVLLHPLAQRATRRSAVRRG
jgi:protein-S-isoprenylcysteine O-methyltransferase Ste14